MKKLKHNKIKNTGILFELLSNQITADTINNRQSPALNILKEYFSVGTELHKEFILTNSLLNEKIQKEERAAVLIETVLENRKKINERKLSQEKYNLVNSISKSYKLREFFNIPIKHYKVHASIYKLFESLRNKINNPTEVVTSRFTLLEYITNTTKDNKTVRSAIVEEFNSQERDVKILAYKLMLDKFNDKYKTLDAPEKRLLREYVNTLDNSTELRTFILNEITKIRKVIVHKQKLITDPATKIKLQEVCNIIDSIQNKKKLNENVVYATINMYQLVRNLKNIK